MSNIIQCVIYIFAIYGLISLLFGLAELIRHKSIGMLPDVKVVLLVRNAEEHIEYIIRYAVRNDITSKLYSDKKLTVVDMASEDDTPLILEKLQKDHSNIEVLSHDDRELVFKDFASFHS